MVHIGKLPGLLAIALVIQCRLLLGESSSLAGSQVSLGGIAAKWWSQKKKTRGRDPGWGRGEVSAAPQRSSAAAVWHSM